MGKVILVYKNTWMSGDDRKLLSAVGLVAMDCSCLELRIFSSCV